MLVLVVVETGFAGGIGLRVLAGFSEGFTVAATLWPEEATFLIEKEEGRVAVEVSFG